MTTVSVWKEAAAVILVSRQSKRILMLRRGSAASFMPNSLVFPGGVVSKADAKSAKLDDRIKICALRVSWLIRQFVNDEMKCSIVCVKEWVEWDSMGKDRSRHLLEQLVISSNTSCQLIEWRQSVNLCFRNCLRKQDSSSTQMAKLKVPTTMRSWADCRTSSRRIRLSSERRELDSTIWSFEFSAEMFARYDF